MDAWVPVQGLYQRVGESLLTMQYRAVVSKEKNMVSCYSVQKQAPRCVGNYHHHCKFFVDTTHETWPVALGLKLKPF